jgi:hypothetical protein
VSIAEATDPSQADATLNMGTTSAVGGYADGVLGCTTDGGQITLINGWNFYAGSNPAAIGAGQYDFETVVTHELGHALGLGHSSDSASLMYATLNPGEVKRTLSTVDLNVPDSDTVDACGLHASVLPGVVMTGPNAATDLPASQTDYGAGFPGRDSSVLPFTAHLVSSTTGEANRTDGVATRDALFAAIRLEGSAQSRASGLSSMLTSGTFGRFMYPGVPDVAAIAARSDIPLAPAGGTQVFGNFTVPDRGASEFGDPVAWSATPGQFARTVPTDNRLVANASRDIVPADEQGAGSTVTQVRNSQVTAQTNMAADEAIGSTDPSAEWARTTRPRGIVSALTALIGAFYLTSVLEPEKQKAENRRNCRSHQTD